MMSQEISEYSLCIVSDKFFSDFPHDRHMQNKNESRPYFLAIKGKDGIYWLVPISHMVDKYKEKIKKDTEKHGDCLLCCIGTVMGQKRAFLIGNMIPVTEEYIKRPYTIRNIPYVIRDKEFIKQIKSKVSRYLSLVRYKKLHPTVDILSIERALLNRKANAEYMI